MPPAHRAFRRPFDAKSLAAEQEAKHSPGEGGKVRMGNRDCLGWGGGGFWNYSRKFWMKRGNDKLMISPPLSFPRFDTANTLYPSDAAA